MARFEWAEISDLRARGFGAFFEDDDPFGANPRIQLKKLIGGIRSFEWSSITIGGVAITTLRKPQAAKGLQVSFGMFRNVPAIATLILTGACSVFGGPAAPEPDYTVVRTEAPFEIRDYPELVIVSTAMTNDSGAAFGKLFDYISGANRGSRKISMTAPVLQSPEGDKIEMTAPVLQGGIGEGGSRQMGFVLPQNFSVETAPLPVDLTVSLSTVPARRVAVVRFNGRLSDEAAGAQRVKLLNWMSKQGIEPVGPAVSAGYHPPWTLPPLRRNEIFIPIDAQLPLPGLRGQDREP